MNSAMSRSSRGMLTFVDICSGTSSRSSSVASLGKEFDFSENEVICTNVNNPVEYGTIGLNINSNLS